MLATTNSNQANSNSQPKAPKASKPVAPKANGKASKPVAPVAPAPKAGNRPGPKAGNRPGPKAGNRPGPKAGNRPGPKAGQQRVTVLGYSLYGFSQWFANQGYSYAACQHVLAKLAQNGSPNMATVKTAYSDCKNPKYSRPAPVSPAHAKQVAGLVKASQPKAPKASKTVA